MDALNHFTKQELEDIYSNINQQLNVLNEEQKNLNQSIERLLRNREVFGALIDLKAIKEQSRSDTTVSPPD